MKPIRWALTLVFAALCFTGGVLVDRALSGAEETASAVGIEEEKFRPICKNVLRPTFVWSSSGLLFNPEPAKPLSRARAEELFSQALETTNFSKRADLLHQVAAGLPEDDLQEALEWAGQIPLGEDRTFFESDLLARWAEKDVASALEYAQGMKQGGRMHAAVVDVVNVWMRHDVEAALGWVLEQPNGDVRSRALQSAIWQISPSDPARAAELTDHLDPMQADLQMGTIYRQWAAMDPDVAAERAGQLPPGQGRFMALHSVASAWAENDIDAALSWIKTLEPGPETEGILSAAIVSYGMVQNEPRRALELAMEQDSPGAARSVLLGLSYQLGQQDFQDTIDWAKALPDGKFRDEALQTLGWELTMRKPEEAIKLADALSLGESRNLFVHRAVSEWTRTDPEKAAAYVERMSDDEMRQSAMDGLIANWALNDPKKAAEFAERNCRGEEMNRVAGVLVSDWAYKDPEAAADWLGRNSHEVPPYVVENLVSSWLGSDRDKATAWIEALPSGNQRDHAMLALGTSMTYEDPQAAWDLAQQIENDELRESALFEVVDNWMIDDEEAAREWIQQADLSEDFKKELLEEPGLEALGACECVCPCM